MIPTKNLDPTQDLHHFEKLYPSKPMWIQPYQHYVWRGRSCVQKWVEPSEIRALATKLGKLHIVLVGTSRVLDTSTAMRMILNSDKVPGFTALTPLTYVVTEVASDVASAMTKVLERHFNDNNVCPPHLQHDPNAPTMAILVSHGIWEARYSIHVPFNFTANTENTIQFIQERCKGRKYRIVVMTNPVEQPFDARLYELNTKRPEFYLSEPTLTKRIEVANKAWRKAAAKYNLLLVDAAKANFPRRDATYDNTHYVLCDPTTHRRIHGRVGNEVSVTFAQLALAAFLQAFE